MKFLSKILPLTLLTPLFALAQSASVGNFQGIKVFIGNITGFVNGVLVPAIFALAFFVFLWGMFKTFILGGDDEGQQEKGKQLMMYALAGFVIMVSFWGIVNLVSGSFGFTGQGIENIPNLPDRQN